MFEETLRIADFFHIKHDDVARLNGVESLVEMFEDILDTQLGAVANCPNAVELKAIADYLDVKMEELTRITAVNVDTNIVHAFMGKVQSEQAKQALQLADELSDMILFHKKVRENGNAMMVAWEDD